MLGEVGGPADGAETTVLYANPHVLNTAYRNSELHRQLRNATKVYCDGVGVRLGARLLGKRLPPRLTAADWIDNLCAEAARRRVGFYFVGGVDGVARRAADVLARRHAGLRIVGTHHGYLDPSRSETVISEINRLAADIVLVGMGTPTQELWIGRYRDQVGAPVVWAVGALLDFVAGEQTRAPAWMRRMHLEWLWRLGTDPVRLGGRYLIGNPLFLLRVLRQRVFGLPRHLRPDSGNQDGGGSAVG